jgi:hypothetical protein
MTNLWKDANCQEFCLNLELTADGVTPGVVYFQTVTGGIRSEYVVPKVF